MILPLHSVYDISVLTLFHRQDFFMIILFPNNIFQQLLEKLRWKNAKTNY